MEKPNAESSEKPQELHALQLQEVPGPLHGINTTTCVGVTAAATDPLPDVEKKVLNALQDRYWWLSRCAQEKGQPQEQCTIEIGDARLDVYNYGEPLSEESRTTLAAAVRLFIRSTRARVIPNLVRYIIIDNVNPPNPHTGEGGYGDNNALSQSITLYPRAVENGPYRISGVRSLSAVLFHELSHNLEPVVAQAWQHTFGWHYLDTPRPLPGGSMQYAVCDQPERCPNDYASISPAEDFCESMVAALENAALDRARQEFLRHHVFHEDPHDTLAPATVTVKTGKDIITPRIPEPVLFYRKPPPIIRRKATSNAVQKTLEE